AHGRVKKLPFRSLAPGENASEESTCARPVRSGTTGRRQLSVGGRPAMSDAEAFRHLIRQVRAGEPQAIAQMVRQYEPAIRLAVHVRLTDPALRRLMDSQDICQSVLASFLVRAAAGQYEVDTPDQLVRLLATMARNKLVNQATRQRAARRDHRHLRPHPATAEDIGEPGPDPSEVAAPEEPL